MAGDSSRPLAGKTTGGALDRPPRRRAGARRFATLAVAFRLAVLAPSLASAQAPGASRPQALDHGRRVQVVARALGAGWHAGVVGRLVREGERDECPTIVVPLSSVTALRVSNLVEKQSGSGAPPSLAPAATPERWSEVSLAMLRSKYAGCMAPGAR